MTRMMMMMWCEEDKVVPGSMLGMKPCKGDQAVG